MGLMEPEDLSCNGVKTDKGSLINSSGFPEKQIVRDGDLTRSDLGEDNTDHLASTIVSDILDESIEIFNKVDGTNVQNNNNDGANTSNTSVANQNLDSSDYPDKTDRLVEISYNLDPSNKLNCETIINFDNFTSPVVETVDSDTLQNCGGMLLNVAHSNNDSAKLSRINSISSEEDSESPVITDSESSLSQSNENISEHFPNVFIENTKITLNQKVLDNNYSGVNVVQDKSNNTSQFEAIEHAVSNVPSDFPNIVQINGCQRSAMSLPLEVSSDLARMVSEPTSVTISGEHLCSNHPDFLELKKEYDEISHIFTKYKEKAERLDDCLADLEKMLDKVGLLEKKICQQEMELDLNRQEKDIESRTLTSLRQETTAKIESLRKQYEQANKEKENMVMRYAKSEKELLDMKKEKTTLLKQIKDQQKENENILSKLRLLSDDKSRLAVHLDNKNTELSATHKEVDKLKEDINSRDIKIKWIQNKLLGEMDLHKECPDKIDKLNNQLLEMEKLFEKNKEEIEHCKKTIQDLEAIKVLEGQVREEQAKLIMERHDQSERVIKMKALQLKTEALIEENNNLSHQVQNLEVERLNLEKRLSESRQESQERAIHLADLRSKLTDFDSISNQLVQESERLEKTNEEVERLRKANEELMQDMSMCRSREAEMLSFTQKLTSKNVQLQSEFSNIESRAGELMLEAENAESTSDTLRREVKLLKEELETERQKREEERNLLAREVAEGRTKISNLESQLTETKSNLHSSTNKHQALIRELQRELQVCYRKLEQEGKVVQSNSYQNTDNRSNSGSSPNQSSTGRSSPGASSSLTSSVNSIPDATIVQPSHHQLEVSPAILVERILKLQTEAKSYQDKLEFLEDHNTTLVEELKKKGRLLHSYILREQAGALATQASDNHKLEVSKHGGIMASVYGSRPTDEGMTLELSLQINHKLQAILEDTLLKNITLKENIDTLGDEIERLKRHRPS